MLDKIDKIILEHLFAYSRFTSKQLAGVTGLTQQATHYRIKKLEKEGYIIKYDTIINWNILPLIKKIYYVRAQDHDEVIHNIRKNNSVFGLNKVVGNYNVLVWCFFKTKIEQDSFEKQLKGNYWEDISAESVSFPRVSIFKLPLKLKIPKKNKRLPNIDINDVKIMRYLSDGHSRDSVAEIGTALDMDYDFVHYRMKRIIRSEYFFRFPAQVGFKSLDLKLSLLSIKLREKNNIKKITEKLSQLGFFTAIVTNNIDRIHIHLFSEDINQYWSMIKDISNVVGEDLKNLENIHIEDTVILNRYPFQYLLDKRIKSKLKTLGPNL